MRACSNVCIELHYGTVLETLSLLLLAVTRLRRKLGQNSSLKQSHSAFQQNTEPVANEQPQKGDHDSYTLFFN